MESEVTNESVTDPSHMEINVSFPQVAGVVTGWTLDFMFVSLCRCFREDKHDEFNKAMATLEPISQSQSLKGNFADKVKISAFLARIMHGKQLDVQFEEDEHVLPLMSAAKIWPTLEHTVEDKSLLNNISSLLFIQSVAVCLEKGEKPSAVSVLQWFSKNQKAPRNLDIKLSLIVQNMETYHPMLTSFSFSRLREMIQSYIDTYLEKNPSDYLLKAATKMVQSSPTLQGSEDEVTWDRSMSETAFKDREKEKKPASLRTKRKLLSNKITDLWKPDTCKKPYVSVKRVSESVSNKFMETSTYKTSTRKPPQKWTDRLDKYLKEGVKSHGVGRWSRILQDYDFEGRTGVMLKDRWRVLLRAHEVG